MLQAQMEPFNRQQRSNYAMLTTKLCLQISEGTIELRLQKQPEEGTIRPFRLARRHWYAEIEFTLPIHTHTPGEERSCFALSPEQNRNKSLSQA
jgi:hypothetical protein